MRLGYINIYCPMCGKRIKYIQDRGTYHTKNWGVLCSKTCYDISELKYAMMILGKDEE